MYEKYTEKRFMTVILEIITRDQVFITSESRITKAKVANNVDPIGYVK